MLVSLRATSLREPSAWPDIEPAVFGGGAQASAGKREHVDQPARPAGDVAGEEKCVDFAWDGCAGVGEEVFADFEQQR